MLYKIYRSKPTRIPQDTFLLQIDRLDSKTSERLLENDLLAIVIIILLQLFSIL